MSVFAGSALQISTLEPRVRRSQFHARSAATNFALCRPAGLARNDVARAGNAGAGGKSAAATLERRRFPAPVPFPCSRKIIQIRNPGPCQWVVVTLPKEGNPMAYERNPDDPYRPNPADDEYRRAARLDNELQPDAELAEGPASGARVAMFAIAIAVVLGAVFYGLNNSTINQAGTSSTAQNASQTSPPAAPPGMRDATPRANTDQGMTTGAAPSRPQTPPATAPTEMNR